MATRNASPIVSGTNRKWKTVVIPNCQRASWRAVTVFSCRAGSCFATGYCGGVRLVVTRSRRRRPRRAGLGGDLVEAAAEVAGAVHRCAELAHPLGQPPVRGDHP